MLEKILLAPYYLTLKVRHALFNRGAMKVYKPEVPSICLGNITAGGTGKTPHTEMILRTLLGSDDWAQSNIAVLSRGHKRTSRGFQQVVPEGTAAFCGDEPLQMKKKFPAVTVAVDRPREEGCDFLCHPEKIGQVKRGRRCKNPDLPKSDIIVLDDAFQYRSLKAWIDIVLVDYNRPVSKDRLLPFGRLRDLPERLLDADIIIITKCPAYMEDDEKHTMALSLGLAEFDPSTSIGKTRKGREIKVFFTFTTYCPLQPVYPDSADTRYVYSKKLILFSGIAKDTPLRRFLSDTYKMVRHFTFDDHHKYSSMDIRRILKASKEFPTAVVTTTEKDAQRILDYKKMPDFLKERMFQLPIEVAFLSEREKRLFTVTLLDRLREFSN